MLTIMLVFVPHQIVADTDLIDKLIIEREKHKELMSIASSPNPITNVGAKTWREDTLVISNGESYVVPDDVHMLAVKTLKMQDSSSLIIPPRMTRFTLKARFVVIGNNVTIASFGKDAIGHQRNGAGNHGGDAADFYLDFGSIDIRELSIISKGGAGAEGRHGVDGSDGIRARCLKRRYAKRGGDGEAGKKGGNGGSSGKVYIGWDENAQTSGSLNISVSTLGGLRVLVDKADQEESPPKEVESVAFGHFITSLVVLQEERMAQRDQKAMWECTTKWYSTIHRKRYCTVLEV